MSILMLLVRTTKQALHDSRVLREARALSKSSRSVDIVLYGNRDRVTNLLIEGEPIRLIEHDVSNSSWNRITRHIKCIRLTRQYLESGDYDVVHCHDFQPLQYACWAGGQQNALIYDSHELFCGSMAFQGAPKFKRQFYKRLESFYIRRAAVVLTVSPGIKSILKEWYDVPWIEVVENIPDWPVPLQHQGSKKSYQVADTKPEHVSLVYQGLISMERGVQVLSKMMDLLPSCYYLTLVGPSVADVKDRFQRFGNRVHFTGLLSQEEMRNELLNSDLGIYPIQDCCLSYHHSLPNKLFEAIYSQLPVVVSDLPDMTRLVHRYDIGSVAVHDDPHSFAHEVRKAIEEDWVSSWRFNCAARAIPELTWQSRAARLVNIYDELQAV